MKLFFINILLASILLFVGEVGLTSEILLELRLPKMLSAYSVGSLLGLSGLLIQSYFKNPLAGPYVLGIQSGAMFFVAIIILVLGTTASLPISLGAILGSAISIGIVLFANRFFRSKAILLIIGLLLSYFYSSLISILYSFTHADRIKRLIEWGFGSFGRTSFSESISLTVISVIILVVCISKAKELNKYLLGTNISKNLGVNSNSLRLFIIMITSIGAGVATAFCGPISFVGMLTPHLVRKIYKTNDHKVMIVKTSLLSSAICLSVQIIQNIFYLPINSILGLVGIPTLIYFFYTEFRGKL